jgi:hypothetical protein
MIPIQNEIIPLGGTGHLLCRLLTRVSTIHIAGIGGDSIDVHRSMLSP